MTGVWDSTVGLTLYVLRAAIITGPNLVCTLVYLTLMAHATSRFALGVSLVLLLDNTTGENKTELLVGFCGWLVEHRIFIDATLFFLPKGHTYSLLDQSFSALMN